jgi:choline dehydrogenase
MVALFFPRAGCRPEAERDALSKGPAALRSPAGPLPADPADDINLSPDLQATKEEAERRVIKWETTGSGLVASSLVDAVTFYSTGLGDTHSHNVEIFTFVTAGDDELVHKRLNVDSALFYDDPAKRLAPDSEGIYVMPNMALPHSEGEIVGSLARKSQDRPCVSMPPFLAEKHGYKTSDQLSDALLEDLALHFADRSSSS